MKTKKQLDRKKVALMKKLRELNKNKHNWGSYEHGLVIGGIMLLQWVKQGWKDIDAS